MIIGFSILSAFFLVFFWPSSSYKWETTWEYNIEPGIYDAPEEVTLGNMSLSLETYMWRDFMPISPPDGKPLIVVIMIHAQNVVEFPLTVQIDRIWIINGSSVRSTLATNETRTYNNTLEMVFRDGPKWGPGISIDVVVKLKYLDFSFLYLLAPNQTIYMTV